MPEDLEETLTGELDPPESSPGNETPGEPEGEPAAGETPPEEGEVKDGETPPEGGRGPITYDRFKEVIDQRNARDEALKAAGLKYDQETGQVVKVEEEEPAEAAPPEAEDDWPDPEPQEDLAVFEDESFWSKTPAEMAQNETWLQIAKGLKFDPEEMYDNDWAAVWNLASQNYQRILVDQQVGKQTELQARQQVTRDIQAIQADPELSLVPKAVQFVQAEVQRFKKAGFPAAEIRNVLPGIKMRAYYDHRKEFVKAEAERIARGEGAREVRLGAEPPETPVSAPQPRPAARLTADEKALCDMAGMSYESYAARKEKSSAL